MSFTANFLSIVLLLAAPVVAWAIKYESRSPWAAFAGAGWVRLLFWWLDRDVADSQALAPWTPLTWQLRDIVADPPFAVGQDRVNFLMMGTYLDALLVGLIAAFVCSLAIGAGRQPEQAS